jgi:hypothetical protein
VPDIPDDIARAIEAKLALCASPLKRSAKA